MRRALLALSATFVPTLAFAHTGVGETGGFLHGFAHPIGGTDHVLAMVAVGALAAVVGGRALWLVPLAFLGMMVVGFGLGAGQVELPAVELLIALSSVVIGAAAAFGRSMPLGLAAGLAGGFALFHGHAHGAEMPLGESGVLYASGFVAATALLHGLGLAGTLGLAQLAGRHGALAGRVTGAAFAVGGLGVLAGWL
ncbi:HupE/UreJ family protein [Aureimonas sp. AU4]|uniref:HupE/UreJ family protein n=1 Tax=Aureimonas sp. AU4 TaxID=1638163 RepID=UPI00078375DA|nr:HupE/UreJ family protein [Aureimonas sp. AU4]